MSNKVYNQVNEDKSTPPKLGMQPSDLLENEEIISEEAEENAGAGTSDSEQQDQIVNSIGDLHDIPPLTFDEFYQNNAYRLFDAPPGSPNNLYLIEKIPEYFDENEVDIDEIITQEDPRILQIFADFTEYFADRLKSDAFSLNAEDVNNAVTELNAYAGLSKLQSAEIPQKVWFKILYNRLSNIPKINDAVNVLQVGSDLFNMINSTSQTMVTQIETENKVQSVEDFYAKGIINRDQMACGYHNLAILFERMSTQTSVIKSENMRQAVYGYMRNALSLTSNPQLIKTCYECLPEKTNNKMQLIQEACDRAMERPDLDDSQMFKIHTLYSKTLIHNSAPLYGMNKGNNLKNYEEAMYHYRQALQYACTKDQKAKVLRSIIKLQKNTDVKASLDTRLELTEQYLEGKTKVRELLSIAAETKDTEIKKLALESSVNELIDTPTIKPEERSLLLKNSFNQLREIYSPENDAKKLEVLNSLEKRYCPKTKKKTTYYGNFSSRGHDYFTKEK